MTTENPQFRVPRRALPTASLFLVAALATACGGDASPQGGRPGVPGGRAGGPAAVQTEAVERGRIAREITVSGIVEPIRTVGVNSQLAGALLSVEVEEGTPVQVGTVLARIDHRELEAQLAAAEAAFQVAEASYERAERLREQQVISLPEYERERTAFVAAKAQYDQLETRIGFATVTSPIRGVVLAQQVEQGDVVGSQQRLFTVGDISTLVIPVGVSELDVVTLSVGQPVPLTLDAFPGRVVTGSIRRIFPSADPNTRLVTVEVALDANTAPDVRPGFLARARFTLAERPDVLVVPERAVLGLGAERSVFVVEGTRAVERPVDVGLAANGIVEIVSGVGEGDQIVVAGNQGLRDGVEVRVVGGAAVGGAEAERGPSGTMEDDS